GVSIGIDVRGGIVTLAGLSVTSKVPLNKIEIRFGTEKAPGHHTAGIDKVFNKIIRLSHRLTLKGGLRQIVQAFKTATLQQFRKTAFQCHLKAWVRSERGKHTAGTRVH